MKAVKRRTILLVLAMMLVLSLTVGLTMAYFSDYTTAEGGKKVTLGGQTTIDEDQPDAKTKIIRITNTGETDVIVRVAVYGPTAIKYSGSGWSQSGDYWYYDSVLLVGETSDPLKAEWEPPKDLGDDYSVLVVQESEMAVYKEDGTIVKPTDAKPAWMLVPAAN